MLLKFTQKGDLSQLKLIRWIGKLVDNLLETHFITEIVCILLLKFKVYKKTFFFF